MDKEETDKEHAERVLAEIREDLAYLSEGRYRAFLLYCKWIVFQDRLRRLYLRICFPWLGELAQVIRW